MTGTLKILAALARPMTLLNRSCRSIDATPKVIWGWWSMKMTVQFSGVSRLWIRSLAGMAPSFRNGVSETMEKRDEARVGETSPGARRFVIATVWCGLPDDPIPRVVGDPGRLSQ